MRRPLLALCLAALASAFSGSCAEGEPLVGDDCVPNQRVFCRCPDGSGGTQLCARDGKSFGECGPCAPGGGDDDDDGAGRPVCGNGALEAGEQCDDGNTGDGDGCSSICQRSQSGGPLPGDGVDDCEGALPVDLNVGVEFQARQALASAGASLRGSCGGEGAELVFGLKPTIAGRLELTLTPDDPALDAVIYLRRADCADGASEPENGCQNGASAGGEERLSVPVDANTPYFVFVDAQNTEMGAAIFTLSARINPPEPCQGEGDACETGLPGACSQGTLRCNDGQFLVCRSDQTSEEEVCGDGLDNDCDGDADEGCPCAHDKCQEGAQLAPGCTAGAAVDPCVQAICDADPFCCDPVAEPDGLWDEFCVNNVYLVCGQLSCEAHEGQCAHSVCSQGAFLQKGCDADIKCVDKVCAEDAFCCGTPNQSGPSPNWDAQCVNEASTLCKLAGKPDACDF